MSSIRQTEILENESIGWASEKITASGAETKTVKTTAGKVAKLFVTSAINVTLKDNETEKWEAINDATQDWSNSPIQCDTSIKLTFSASGNAWIIYK